MKNSNKEDYPFYIWFNYEKKEEYYNTGLFLYLITRHDEENGSMKLKQSKSIISGSEKGYILKHPSYMSNPYVERIGTMLVSLLNADLKDFNSAYDTFLGLYGFDLLKEQIGDNIDITRFEDEVQFKEYYNDMFLQAKSYLVKVQKDFREVVDIVYNLSEKNTFEEASAKSKLIALLIKNETNIHKYTNNINIEYENYATKKKDYANIELKDLIMQIDEDNFIKATTIYSSKYLGDICFAILNKLVNMESIIIKKCKRCGKYFIPTIRNDEIYCDIANVDGSSTCREIGAKETYKRNLETVPGLLEYRRSYQKKLMFCSRNKEDKQLKKDFDKWKKEAQAKIKEYKNGNLSDEMLLEWMMENK